MSIKSLITGGGDGLIAKVRNLLDAENRLCVDAVIDTVNQEPIPITFSVPGGGSLPKMVSLYYNQSVGAVRAGTYARALTYVVPVGFNGYVIRYSSYQAEAANSRLVSEIGMGTLNIITNSYVAGASYIVPQWTGNPQFEITQAIGSAANVTITVEYTNAVGISARTGTCVIPKSSIIGGRWDLVLQAGDLGVRSVQNMSVAPTSTSGAVKLLGFIQLGYHEDAGTAAYETLYAPGATTFPTGTVLGIEFQGGIVSKTRRFDVLLQLITLRA